ncbi:MAG: AsnC family transcriptional regulator [Promethearchaeota archaeon]
MRFCGFQRKDKAYQHPIQVNTGYRATAGGRVTFKPSVLEDHGAWLLIKRLLDGTIGELVPVFDVTAPYGFRYPEAEKVLEADPKDTVDRLEGLRRAGILEGKLSESIFTCSECSSPDLHPQSQCPSCAKNRLVHQPVIEHFSCGFIGPRTEFESEKGLRCPSCREFLSAEQQDYKSEEAFQCLDCKTVSAQPRLVFRCFQCQNTAEPSVMTEQAIYVYHLNIKHRGDIIHYLGFHPTPEAEKPSRRKHRADLDDMDRRILNILQRDARLSFRNIARRLKVSDATVRSRVSRLEQNNVIKGFTTLVDPQQVGMEVIALIQLEVDAKLLTKLNTDLQTVEEVKLVLETGDRANMILLTSFVSRDTLNSFLDSHIRGRQGVQLVSVTLALGIRKYDWMIQL